MNVEDYRGLVQNLRTGDINLAGVFDACANAIEALLDIIENLQTKEENLNMEVWKERLAQEYWDLKGKCARLENFMSDWNRYSKWDKKQEKWVTFHEHGESWEESPKCSYQLLMAQLRIMNAYVAILEERAILEDINIFQNQPTKEVLK